MNINMQEILVSQGTFINNNDNIHGETFYIYGDKHKGNVIIEKSSKGYVMRNILLAEELQGKGIGSAIYRYINTLSKQNTGYGLHSIIPTRILEDGTELIELSDAGRGLWENFVKNNEAYRRSDSGYIMQ